MGLTNARVYGTRASYSQEKNNMEQQLKLWKYEKELFGRAVVSLEPNSNSLEQEKEKFIQNMSSFVDRLNFEVVQIVGRPKADFKAIIKGLLVMSYHGFSYRRALSDLRSIHNTGLISFVPSRSVLNLYANDVNTKQLISRMIQASATFFTEDENTIILDSTWMALQMYVGGYEKVHDKKSGFDKCRKLHIAVLKNSKAIGYATTSKGTAHDSPFFEELVSTIVHNGFSITSLLADAGYSSKENYAICKELGIQDAYIDFRSNATAKRAKSDLWREKIKLFREQKEIWHESYKFRSIVEGVFSAIKRKHLNYLRSRNEVAQDNELLLKCLVYNITVIGRYT